VWPATVDRDTSRSRGFKEPVGEVDGAAEREEEHEKDRGEAGALPNVRAHDRISQAQTTAAPARAAARGARTCSTGSRGPPSQRGRERAEQPRGRGGDRTKPRSPGSRRHLPSTYMTRSPKSRRPRGDTMTLRGNKNAPCAGALTARSEKRAEGGRHGRRVSVKIAT